MPDASVLTVSRKYPVLSMTFTGTPGKTIAEFSAAVIVPQICQTPQRGGKVTVTVALLVRVPPSLEAVSVKIVVAAGAVEIEPMAGNVPIPEIVTVAVFTTFQLKVEGLP